MAQGFSNKIQSAVETAYRFGDFALYPSDRLLKRGTASIALQPKAFDALAGVGRSCISTCIRARSRSGLRSPVLHPTAGGSWPRGRGDAAAPRTPKTSPDRSGVFLQSRSSAPIPRTASRIRCSAPPSCRTRSHRYDERSAYILLSRTVQNCNRGLQWANRLLP